MKRKKKKNNQDLVCIVPYPSKDESKYTDIKETSGINEKRIRLAKLERQTFTDETFHRAQCASIPNQNNNDRPGIHL